MSQNRLSSDLNPNNAFMPNHESHVSNNIDLTREILENMPQYNGKNVSFFKVFDDESERAFIFHCTDSDDFGTIDNLLNYGLQPHTSGGKGQSKYGTGKSGASHMQAYGSYEAIGSFIKNPVTGNHEWIFGEAYRTTDGRTTIIDPVTKEESVKCSEFVTRHNPFLGLEWGKYFNFAQLVKDGFKNIFCAKIRYLKPDHRRDGSKIDPKISLNHQNLYDLMIDTSALTRTNLCYLSKLIIKGKPGADLNKYGETHAPAEIRKTTDSNWNLVTSFPEFKDNFVRKEYNLQLDSHEIAVKLNNGRNIIVKAHCLMTLCDAVPDGGNRLRIIDTTVSPRSAGNTGHKPENLLYLKVVALDPVASKEIKNNPYQRFKTNAVRKQAERGLQKFIQLMNLPYRLYCDIKDKAFIISEIIVTDIVRMEDDDGTHYTITPEMRESLEDMLKCNCTFRVDDKFLNEIAKRYAEVCEPPQILKDFCNKFFKQDEVECTKWEIDSPVTRGDTNTDLTVFDMFECCRHEVNYNAGTGHCIAILNHNSSKFLDELNFIQDDHKVFNLHKPRHTAAEFIEFIKHLHRKKQISTSKKNEIICFVNDMVAQYGIDESYKFIHEIFVSRLQKNGSDKDASGNNYDADHIKYDFDNHPDDWTSWWNLRNQQIRISVAGLDKPNKRIGKIPEVPVRHRTSPPPPPPPPPPKPKPKPGDGLGTASGDPDSKGLGDPKPSIAAIQWCEVGEHKMVEVTQGKSNTWRVMLNKNHPIFKLIKPPYADATGTKAWEVQNYGVVKPIVNLASAMAYCKIKAETEPPIDSIKLNSQFEHKDDPTGDSAKATGYIDVIDQDINTTLNHMHSIGMFSDALEKLNKIRGA
jgi:hypothetical protein